MPYVHTADGGFHLQFRLDQVVLLFATNLDLAHVALHVHREDPLITV